MRSHDVLILGGGLVGLTLALALDAHGISCAVVDPAEPDTQIAPGFDGRASAIASASWRMLEAIGVADKLRPHGCPIRRIEVRDGLQSEALDFTPGPDDAPLGTMVENRRLRMALRTAASAASLITLYAPDMAVSVDRGAFGVTARLASGIEINAALVIAAEGRNSPSRAAAGIKVAQWRYNHRAIISALEHEYPHDNVAHEIFYPAGPFALLPMLPGNRSALVWTVDERDADGILGLGERAFLHEVDKRTGGILGKITLSAPRSSYPLGFHHTVRITAERLALVGDAAHGIHPIAGQGLNLGFRDVAALTEVLVNSGRLGLDLGDAQVLQRYERWRSVDSFAVAMATDSLTRLFGLKGRTASSIRRFGLGTVQRTPPLKAAFMAEARGESGSLPKLLQGEVV